MAESASGSGSESTPVTILGRTYRLRGDGDGAYLAELARLVDARMREIEAATGTADSLKVAILASLNLADDYMKASRSLPAPTASDSEVEALKTRLQDMVARLDEALAG